MLSGAQRRRNIWPGHKVQPSEQKYNPIPRSFAQILAFARKHRAQDDKFDKFVISSGGSSFAVNSYGEWGVEFFFGADEFDGAVIK